MRQPHLFLITEKEDRILLSSYEIPNGEDKNTFSYEFMKEVEYIELKKSKKFTPALYYERNGVWEGGSTSQFSPVMIFKLWEKFFGYVFGSIRKYGSEWKKNIWI